MMEIEIEKTNTYNSRRLRSPLKECLERYLIELFARDLQRTNDMCINSKRDSIFKFLSSFVFSFSLNMQHEYITSTHRYRSEVKFSNVPGGIFVMSSDERSLEEKSR